jgi:hypothetical protein
VISGLARIDVVEQARVAAGIYMRRKRRKRSGWIAGRCRERSGACGDALTLTGRAAPHGQRPTARGPNLRVDHLLLSIVLFATWNDFGTCPCHVVISTEKQKSEIIYFVVSRN